MQKCCLVILTRGFFVLGVISGASANAAWNLFGKSPPPSAKEIRDGLKDIPDDQLNDQQLLQRFARNLTEKALESTKPYYGNLDEIADIKTALTRPDMKGAIAIGDAGAGKTSILTQVAREFAPVKDQKGKITQPGKTFWLMNIVDLKAGAFLPGQFEKRLVRVRDAIISQKDTILVVDEAHELVKADLMDKIKDVMGDGQFTLALMTDLPNFRKYFEKDEALRRRLRPVFINTPDFDAIITAVRGNYIRLAADMDIRITDEGLKTIVTGTQRFLPNLPQISTALTVLSDIAQEAVTTKIDSKKNRLLTKIEQLRVEAQSLRVTAKDNKFTEERYAARLKEIDQQIATKELDLTESTDTFDAEIRKLSGRANVIYQKLKLAEEQRNFERVSFYRAELLELDTEQGLLLDRHPGAFVTDDQMAQAIGRKEVFEYFQRRTGIPGLAVDDPKKFLEDMKGNLQSQIIGRDQAIEAIMRGQKRAVANMLPGEGPRSVTLLTGVQGGRMALAEALAKYKYTSPKRLVKIAMEKLGVHAEMDVRGSGRGLVNNEEGGLFENVRQLEGNVVMVLSGMDAAHPNIYRLMQDITITGRMDDSMGRPIDFHQVDVIITASWAAEFAANHEAWLADRSKIFDYFDEKYNGAKLSDPANPHRIKMIAAWDSIRDPADVDQEFIRREMTLSGVGREFRDSITTRVLITPATYEDALKIVDLHLKRDEQQVWNGQSIHLNYAPNVRQALVEQYFSDDLGYASVKNGKAQSLDDFLADLKLSLGNRYRAGDRIDIGVEKKPDGSGTDAFVAKFTNSQGQFQMGARDLITYASSIPRAAAGRVSLTESLEEPAQQELFPEQEGIRPGANTTSLAMKRAIKSLKKLEGKGIE